MMRSAARHMRRTLVLVTALGAAVIALTAAPAAAQVAAAIGKPLPSPDLAVGLVTVKVVAGNASAPVTGTDVTLVVNDVPRQARTDSAGRASFPGLPPGATAVAKVLDEDKTAHESEKFAIPESGGTRILLTTRPWQGGGGGAAPFAGGGAGMPNPRKLSGEPRGEQADPSGQLTVRVTYDDFQDTPEGIAVALVGYAADDSTSYQVERTDKAGRVQFQDLDRSGGTSYFAMALLPRNDGLDRVTSIPVLFDSQSGVRMVLSGEKRSSQAPALDDFARADPQVATPAGKVRVVLEGAGDISGKVALIDAATRKPLGQAAPQLAPPDLSRIQSASEFLPDNKLPAGTLEILVVGGSGPNNDPLKDVEVRVIPAASSDTDKGPAQVTGADGRLRMVLPATEPQRAVFTINGRPQISKTFDISKAGGKLLLGARWEDTGRPEAVFDAGPGLTVYAEYSAGGQRYRSMPFQTLEKTGSKVTIVTVPRIQFQFQLEADVEDELLAVRGRFVVINNSWAPYRAGPDGLIVPLPHGFKGAVVADTDQAEVSVAPGEGFRLMRPIPPEGQNISDPRLRISKQNLFDLFLVVADARQMRDWIQFGCVLDSFDKIVGQIARRTARAISHAAGRAEGEPADAAGDIPAVRTHRDPGRAVDGDDDRGAAVAAGVALVAAADHRAPGRRGDAGRARAGARGAPPGRDRRWTGGGAQAAADRRAGRARTLHRRSQASRTAARRARAAVGLAAAWLVSIGSRSASSPSATAASAPSPG